MASFSVSDAAVEGFRLTRERPRMILYWSLALLALNLVTAVLVITLIGPEWEDVQAALSRRSSDPAERLRALQGLLPVYAITVPIGLVTGAVLQAAVCRAVFGEGGAERGYLKLGGDELRVLAAQVAVAALLLLAGMAGGFVVGFAAAAVGGGLAGFLLLMALLALVLWLGVRLSLAAPQTYAERRIRVFGSWRLTRRQGWRLFAAYLIALLLALVVTLLALAIYAAVMALIGGGVAAAGSMFQPDYGSFGAHFTPGMIVGHVIGAVISALFHAIMLAPAAVAYRSLAAEPTA